jgi:hypothetical protein
VDFGAGFNGAIINLVAAKAPIVAVISTSFMDEQNYGGFYVLQQPREVVIARFKDLLAHRGRGENPSLADYWRPSTSDVQGGLIQAYDFQVWIDWLVKDGQLRPGVVQAAELYTNELNPYVLIAARRWQPTRPIRGFRPVAREEDVREYAFLSRCRRARG